MIRYTAVAGSVRALLSATYYDHCVISSSLSHGCFICVYPLVCWGVLTQRNAVCGSMIADSDAMRSLPTWPRWGAMAKDHKVSMLELIW